MLSRRGRAITAWNHSLQRAPRIASQQRQFRRMVVVIPGTAFEAVVSLQGGGRGERGAMGYSGCLTFAGDTSTEGIPQKWVGFADGELWDAQNWAAKKIDWLQKVNVAGPNSDEPSKLVMECFNFYNSLSNQFLAAGCRAKKEGRIHNSYPINCLSLRIFKTFYKWRSKSYFFNLKSVSIFFKRQSTFVVSRVNWRLIVLLLVFILLLYLKIKRPHIF